ncbi:MAG: WYL domain-containing protein [Corynebacterium casei]|uniref:WYL domain-containing protein n=1 Tax=Corynebacterium casei TaxID=160386 RepID=UPI00264964E0|nr:WYL domain-containing protein [Corynebacterium casei]MDN6274030.1 WYL domain-containing protein [Corynebacterium casei]
MGIGSADKPIKGNAGQEYVALGRHISLYLALLGAANSGGNASRTSEWIRKSVHDYKDKSDEAFDKALRRDIQVLRHAGIPISHSRDASGHTHYQLLLEQYALPDVEFTPEEVMALSVAAGFGNTGGLGDFSQSGWTKLAASGATRSKQVIPVHTAVSDMTLVQPVVIRDINTIIRNGLRMSFEYKRQPGVPAERRLMDPWGLVTHHNRVYLVGFDVGKGAPRVFRILRVASVKARDEKSTHPPVQESLQTLVNDALLRSQTAATLRVDADKAYELIEEAQDNGDGTFFFEKASMDWLVRTALSYADSAEVLEPDEIRTQIVELAEKALDEDLVDLSGELTKWRHDEVAEEPAQNSAHNVSTMGPRIHRLVRIANVIPYFRRHPNKSMMEAATDLDMTHEELAAALNTLFVSGATQNTEDLIDLSWDFRKVNIIDSQGMDKALRLTPTEASALLLALESLESMPGLIDPQAVQSAANKIRGIMDTKTEGIYDSLATTPPEESKIQAALATAVNTNKKVRFDYWSPGTNESSTRTVDPVRVFLADSELYLSAWAEDRDAHRTFRLDRMRGVEVLEEYVTPKSAVVEIDPTDPFGFSSSQRATLFLHESASWMADYHDITLSETARNGWIEGSMPIGRDSWFVRFALSNADRIQVISPENIRSSILDTANQAIARYTRLESK